MAFDNIKLEKGLYSTGKTFTQALEEIDPSENYRGTSLEGLDAYERQLKRFDIKVADSNSDPVSKFFATTDSAALFPEYVSRAVKLGITDSNKVDSIVATTTEIDSMDYRSISTSNNVDDFNLANVNEGAALPELNLKLKNKLTKLQKHGKMLVASYEAIKFQKLDLFTITLKQIGEHIANSEFNQAVKSILDNNGSLIFTSSANKYTYDDLVEAWTEFFPHNMTTFITGRMAVKNLLTIPEFIDAAAGMNFHSTGNIGTPFGAEVYLTDEITSNDIIVMDKNYAIEKVQAGGVITEFDKLIDRQLERATISTITGFSPIYDDAAMIIQSAN